VAPPKVNVFGELDGAAPRDAKTISESGFAQHTFADEGYDSDVSVSPDGKWLVFASTRNNEHADIYLQRVGGLSVTQLTCDDASDAFPSFSPDGKQIAFCSTRAGTWDIYVMDLDGKNATQITSGSSQDLHPSFSPDGKRLVYCSAGARSGNWELWTVNLTSGEKKMIGQGLFPTWSPDKKCDRIAFQRARQRGSRWFSLWTLDVVDGEARRFTEIAASSNAAIVSPTWSPDGKRLAFATIVNPSRSKDADSQQDIWLIDADGSNRQRLTDGSGVNVNPFWSSDNRIFFVSDRSGNECIWSAAAPRTEAIVDVASGQHEAKD
jgi:TolB protein